MIKEVFLDSVKIILIVAVLMILVEWLGIKFKDWIKRHLTARPANQIIGAGLIGAIPGCIDAFFIVSLYAHGLVGFGALVAVMLSTAGDEAFVMLAMVPKAALLVFGICIVVGIIGGFFAGKIAKVIGLKRARPCKIGIHKEEERESRHFLKEHVYGHIIKKHIPRLFLWIFFTLLVIRFLMQRFDLAAVLPQNLLLLIIIAALVGIIPESGPHLIFLTLFAQGLVPFSVLLVNSLSQAGHGLLPLLSYSVKDSIKVKVFTTVFALIVGLAVFFIGGI